MDNIPLHGRSWCSYPKLFMRSYKYNIRIETTQAEPMHQRKNGSRHPASERHVPPVSPNLGCICLPSSGDHQDNHLFIREPSYENDHFLLASMSITPKQSPSSNLLFWERINVVQQLLCAQCCIPWIIALVTASMTDSCHVWFNWKCWPT